MYRKKTSPIWLIDTNELVEIIKQSNSIGEVLQHFGLPNIGGNGKTLRRRCDANGIDLPKWKNYSGLKRNIATPLSELLVQNSKCSRGNLKRRLIQNGLLQNVCSACGLTNLWNDKPLSLVLDHINRVRDDNRIENLRLLCPNCNSQTATFAGRNNRKTLKCKRCSIQINSATLCNKCRPIWRAEKCRKVVRPAKDILVSQILELGYRGTGKIYGVSDGAIRKWMKNI